MASDLVRFSIAIPDGLLNEFDAYTARRGLLSNRSEAIRDLMRDALVEQDLTDPTVDVVGSLTIVYDHHVPDLTRKIDTVEHSYPDLIVSSMHVHLDHHNCLEIIAVHGPSGKVREMSDCLLGIKGIVYGKLTSVATEGRLRGDAAARRSTARRGGGPRDASVVAGSARRAGSVANDEAPTDAPMTAGAKTRDGARWHAHGGVWHTHDDLEDESYLESPDD